MTSSRLVCGLKLTHDGGLAVVEGNRLRFCVEAEKIDNGRRYAAMNSAPQLRRALSREGLTPTDLDAVAIDGWSRGPDGLSWVEILDADGQPELVDAAGYEDGPDPERPLLEGQTGKSPLFGPEMTLFRSFTHGTDHALASYCTSPFAAEGRTALILVWDGGMPPCLYAFSAEAMELIPFGPLMPISGGLYPIFATSLSPFAVDHTKRRMLNPGPGMDALLPISGKAMAYAGLGHVDEATVEIMEETTAALLPIDGAVKSYMWGRKVMDRVDQDEVSEPSIFASFQEHLYRRLAAALESWLTAHPAYKGAPMCLSGGCALNLKWNSAVRDSGLFDGVWVPPFPNDSGSAIGAACAEMVGQTGVAHLEWSVFSGPEVTPTSSPEKGWSARPCTLDGVAEVLAEQQEPVVIVDGRAELGPRALGHRSIVSPATDEAMRDRLNDMKQREHYRPVAPICLEDRAPEIFAPGIRDPHMLFDHTVRAEWTARVPAIVHADGSARLQTVGPDNRVLHEVLTGYARRTGIPVLCNTSANYSGRGFFPDATSAMRWGRARYVWSDGTMYSCDGDPVPHDLD